MIPNDSPICIDWYLPQLSSERLHPVTNGNRCRDPKPNRSNSWNRAKEREEGFQESDQSRTAHENSEKYVTWVHRSSESINQQPGNLHGAYLGPLHKGDSCVSLSTCRNPNSVSRGCLYTLIYFWGPIPHTGLPFTALKQEKELTSTIS